MRPGAAPASSYPLYIGGEDRPGRGWTYVVRASALIADPATGLALKRALELGQAVPEEDLAGGAVAARCAWGDDDDNVAALEAAARAAPEYARTSRAERKRIGAEFHEELLARGDEFVELLVAEGHPRRLARWELSGVLSGCSSPSLDWYFGKLYETFHHEGRELALARKPDGVVCMNPPQNAAGATSALGVGALLAGNALVVKAPRSTPLGVMWLYREIVAPILERHGAPPGTLNILSGDTRRILKTWLRHPAVDDVMFVGDSASGLKLGAECFARGKKPILELSGNDALVVWRDADLDGAADALVECFYGSSQICMVPKHAIVHPAVADELTERLLERVSAIRPGFPDDPEVLLSPVLKADRFFDFLGEALADGADLLTGGKRVDVSGTRNPAGLFFEPTVLRVDGLDSAESMRCVREETFFPLLPLVVPDEPASDAELFDRVVSFLNANPYGLRNSFWASDPLLIDAFCARVSNGGILKVNESHVAFPPVLSTHGGTGRTGGPCGEINYPVLSTTHLQGISIGTGAQPALGVGAERPRAVGAR